MNKKYNSHRLKLNNILFWDEEKYEIILMDFSNGIYKETDKAYTIIFLFPEVLGGYGPWKLRRHYSYDAVLWDCRAWTRPYPWLQWVVRGIHCRWLWLFPGMQPGCYVDYK